MRPMEVDTIQIENGHTIVKVRVVSFKDGEHYIAFIPSLKLTSASEVSEEESIGTLKNAITLFFKMNKKSEERFRNKMLKLGWKEKINGFFMPVINNKVPTDILANNPNFKEILETEIAC